MIKTKRNSFYMSCISLVLCVAMLIGSTMAWFTDTASNTGNRIVAGNLDVDLLMASSASGTYTSIAGGSGDIFSAAENANSSNKTLWEPGATHVAYLAVQNKGSLALKYNIYLDVTNNGLVGALKYAVVPFGKSAPTADITSWEAATKATTITGDVEAGRKIAAQNGCLDEITKGTKNETEYFALVVHMNEDAGNQYQNASVVIDVNIVATQKNAEDDTFNNTYDQNATYPTVAEVIHESESYSGNFKPSDSVTSQVVAASDIQTSAGSQTILIAQGTGLYKADDNGNDVPITTTNTAEYAGNIISNIDTSDATADSVTYHISYTYKEGTTETSVSKFSAIVTNEFNVSAGLTSVKVYTTHNGGTETELTKLDAKPTGTLTDQAYYYDSVNGKLYIYSSKYSDFRVVYTSNFDVSINGHGYATLEEAIAAAKSGESIVLLKNCTVDADKISANVNVEINSNGYTITRGNEKLENFEGNNIALKYFAGGNGTTEKPWLIASAGQMQSITKLFGEAHSYKIKGENLNIDCTDWTPINLNGCFDGNGATFNNLDDCLFQVILTTNENIECIVKNFTVAETAKVTNTKASTAMIREADSPATLENVKLHGYVEGASMHTAGFFAYTNNNYEGYKACDSLYITNCSSDVTMVGKADDNCCLSGFVGFPIGGAKVYIKDSSYTGSMYVGTGKCGALYSAQMGDAQFYLYNGTEYVQVASSGTTQYDSEKTYHFEKIAPTVNGEGSGYNFEVYSGAKRANVMIEVRGQNSSGTGYPFAVKTYDIDLTDKSGTIDMGFDGVISHIYLNENASGESITETTFDKATGTLCVYNPEYTIGYSLPKINVTQYDVNGNVLSWGSLEPEVDGNKVVDVYINGTDSQKDRPSVFPYPVTGHDYTWTATDAASLTDVHVYLDANKTQEVASSNLEISGNNITVKAAGLTGTIFIFYSVND